MTKYLQLEQKFIGKLKNEHQGKIVTITERMLDDDESTLMFLHHNGFEEAKENPASCKLAIIGSS